MICPILTAVFYAREGKDDPDFSECRQEECAWWDANGGKCAVLEVAKLLYPIGYTLGQLESKIPLIGAK